MLLDAPEDMMVEGQPAAVDEQAAAAASADDVEMAEAGEGTGEPAALALTPVALEASQPDAAAATQVTRVAATPSDSPGDAETAGGGCCCCSGIGTAWPLPAVLADAALQLGADDAGLQRRW